jgi:hypothetical protein
MSGWPTDQRALSAVDAVSGGNVRFDWLVPSHERREAWFRRHPRAAALTIVGFLIGIVVIDLVRFVQARGRLNAEEWTSGFTLGGVIGLILALVAYTIRLPWLRSNRVVRPLEIAAAFAGFLLFAVTHPRYGDDSVTNAGEVAWIVGVDVLLLLLVVAAYRRWPRSHG